ncbi:MAG TPA: GNAT family N-acetyltransferase [Phototrophicaceae bacterium]|nr:GNAT family N-acetyltransferase [Phototrophicaceae bacterium]
MLPLTITPYDRQYLQRLRDLIFHSQMVHTHLDWQETDQWLETQHVPMRLAWQRGRLVGALGVSAPLNHTCWLRLAVVQDQNDYARILRMLWDELVLELRGQFIESVALLAMRDWILHYAPLLDFHYIEDIITLERSGPEVPSPRTNHLVIRAAEVNDLVAMTRVDNCAFVPPWQLSLEELRQAHRISASCTVGLLDETIVGYQLTTLYFDGAHLARLAIMPELQGLGLGGVLLGDTLQRFFRRGVYTMTLNTQSSNQRSRQLYTTYGFRPNGYDLPYWVAHL